MFSYSIKDKQKLITGRIGEDLASTFLASHGYRIIERNFRVRGGELDLVAYDGNTLVFIEVKTRFTKQFGPPEEAITPKKLKFLNRASQLYCAKRKLFNKLCRFDAIVIELYRSGAVKRIELIQNILDSF